MRRRSFLAASTSAALLLPGVATAYSGRQFDALVWQPKSETAAAVSSTCSAAQARFVFGPRFVNYLARFLLAYDIGSRRLWRTLSDEIPLSWSRDRIEEKRTEQLGAFVNTVETGLCAFVPEVGGLVNLTDGGYARAGVGKLLSLLRSRYGDRPDARRQLALLFSLLEPAAQPTRAIAQLIAEEEYRKASRVLLLDAGSLLAIPKKLKQKDQQVLGSPRLPTPAAAGQKRLSAVAQQAVLEPTGKVLRINIDSGGTGYLEEAPPLVSISAPTSRQRSRPALGKARVRNGTVVAIDFTDHGAGYGSERVVVAIAPPKKGSLATARPLLEMQIASVPLAASGEGYGSSQDLQVTWDTPMDSDDETVIVVLREPRATLVLGERANPRNPPTPRFMWPTSGNIMVDPAEGDCYFAKPPLPPAAPNDFSTIESLLALLPPDEGGPIYDPGSVLRDVPKQHRFPSALYERTERPLKTPLGRTVTVKGLAALPTSVSGGLGQNVPLSPGLVARLALAGGLCSAVTRAATNPLDLRKTQEQAKATSKQVEEVPAVLYTSPPVNMANHNQFMLIVEKVKAPENWLGVDASFFAGLALGAGSFGTYEALRRTLPVLVEIITRDPSAPTQYATPILLFASVISTVFSTIVAAPFESARAKIMASTDGPQNLKEALLELGSVDDRYEWQRLWDGLPALLGRELPFGITKLLVFVGVQNTALNIVPAARERALIGVVIAIFSGLIAGVAGALASQPADTVVTRLASSGKDASDWRGVLDDLLAEAETPAEKARLLYAGLPQRCASLAVLVCLQFVLFDSLRTLFSVSQIDLSLGLDLFSDRLSFYEGWDEINQRWIDALDVLNDDYDLFENQRP